MNRFGFNSEHRRGLCFICGKSTKLFIHQACGLEAERRQKEEKEPSGASLVKIRERNKEKTRNKYLSGILPGLSSKDLEV